MITMRTIMGNELHCIFTCFCVQPFVKAAQVLGVYFPALHGYLDRVKRLKNMIMFVIYGNVPGKNPREWQT